MLEVSDSEALGIDEVLKDLENCTQRWNDSIQTNQKNQTGDICLYQDSSPNDMLVTCAFGNVTVHQSGYRKEISRSGMKNRSWFCIRCKYLIRHGKKQNSKLAKGKLCPDLTGGMIFIEEFGWVHIVCVNWLHDIYFKDEDRTTIIDSIPENKRNLEGSICNSSEGIGATCEFKQGGKPFHIRCGVKQGIIRSQNKMQFALNHNGEEIFPIFGKEHQSIGYQTLNEKGIQGGITQKLGFDNSILEETKKIKTFSGKSRIIDDELIDDITSNRLAEMIKKKKEQNANRIKELYNRETKFDKILKVKKKKRSKKQDQKDEDRIKNSSESEYDHEKFSFDNVSSKKKKPKQNRSNPKISSRKQFFLEQGDKLRECPKPSRPVYCKPVIFQSANTSTTLPKPIVYNVDPRLSKFIGLKKGLQCVITSKFIKYVVSKNLIDPSGKHYIISKDLLLYRLLEVDRIKVEETFNHLEQFLTPIKQDSSPTAKIAPKDFEKNDYSKAFDDLDGNASSGYEDTDAKTHENEIAEDADDYKFD